MSRISSKQHADALRVVSEYARSLAKRSSFRPLIAIGLTWAAIGVAVALSLRESTWISLIIGFSFIGTQQYALLILMHDGQHSLLHRNRSLNNFISTWLIGAPCGSPFSSSQRQHLAHHRHLGSTVEDPAYQFYCSGEPSPKHTTGKLTLHFLRILGAGRISYTLMGKGQNVSSAPRIDKTNWFDRRRLKEFAPILLCQAILLSSFSLAGFWWGYFALWVLPLVTLVSFFDAFRQFAEHAQPAEDCSGETLLISTKSNRLERFFFAPFGMNFHAEHHLFPFVPYWKLAALSDKLRGIREDTGITWRQSYARSVSIYIRGLKA